MQLKYNTYTQLSDRVNAAQAKVQERTPDFVVLQPSLVPYKADSPRKILIIIIYGVLGFIGTTIWIFRKDIKIHLKQQCKMYQTKSSNKAIIREKTIRKMYLFDCFQGVIYNHILTSSTFNTPLYRQIQLWNLDDH